MSENKSGWLIMSRLIFIIFLISLNFSAFAEQIKLKSDPEDATIYVRDLNGIQNIKIGVTPFEGNLNDIASNFAKSNFFLIVLEKNGYESQSILLNDVFKSDIELKINLIPRDDILHYRKIDSTISSLFDSSRLMRAGQYDDAITLLKKIETDQPKLSIIPEFLGNAYYLKKDIKGSLMMFESAYRMNPENKDAYLMKEYIKKAFSGKDGKN